MRNCFAEKISEFAKKDKKIYIVAADISPGGAVENFKNKFPNRFINVGVAEQAMIGICAGLAMSGARPFAYTIATFALYRPFEMIRDDLCYQNLPVTIVGMGSGTIYANLGGTHISQEDISIAKTLPNMTIIAPCDLYELSMAIEFCCTKNTGPLYLRIGKTEESNFTNQYNKNWKFGKIRKMHEGKKICIITYGPIMKMAYAVLESLKKENIFISIYSCHTLKPLDVKQIRNIFNTYDVVISLEDHLYIGGLGADIKILAYEYKFKGKILTYALMDKFYHIYSSQQDLLRKHRIYKSKIIKDLKRFT
jgi:transketolase